MSGLGMLALQQAASVDPFTSPRLSAWHRKLKRQVQDSSILVCGDSTGNGNDEWVYLTALKIAAQWPTHTVVYKLWDDATKTYPVGSTTTIQTGTGSRTITVYNCSVAGQTVGYALTNVATIVSGIGTPDLLIYNYGLNSPQGYSDYRGLVHQSLTAYTSRWPTVAVLIVAQSPTASDYVDYARNQESQRANYDYAAVEGHVCADVNSAFLEYGNYAADLLINDKVHPTAAGSALWRNVVWSKIKPKRMVAPSSAPAARVQRLWVPAKAFDALDGSPSYAMNFGVGGWLLDAASEESISAVVDYPSDWSLVSALVHVACPTAPDAGNRVAVLSGTYMYVGGGPTGTTTSATLGTWTAGTYTSVNVTLPTSLGVTNGAELFTRFGGSSRPIAYKFARKAADAADTLAQDLIFLGVMFYRMG